MTRRGPARKLSPEMLRKFVRQDLSNGMKQSEIARKWKIAASTVTKIKNEWLAEDGAAAIEAKQNQILDSRQRLFNDFVVQQADDYMRLCRDVMDDLKEVLDQNRQKAKSSDPKNQYDAVEIWIRQGNQTIRSRKINNEEDVLKRWQAIHRPFFEMQKGKNANEPT